MEGVTIWACPRMSCNISKRGLHYVWWDPHINYRTSWGTVSNVPWQIPDREAYMKVAPFERNCKMLSTSSVWPIDHKVDDMSCVLPTYSLAQPFLKRCTQINKYGPCPIFLLFSKKGNSRYNYLVLGHEGAYFVRNTLIFQKQALWRWHHQDVWRFGRQHFRGLAGKVFQQIVEIKTETNCFPLLADIFLCSNKAEFTQSSLDGKGAISISVQFHVHVDRLWFVRMHPEFGNYLGLVYPIELAIKDTTESNSSLRLFFTSYLDLLQSIECDSQAYTQFLLLLPWQELTRVRVLQTPVARGWTAKNFVERYVQLKLVKV